MNTITPHPTCGGLAESDNSKAQIDIRILRMEFFYYPEYQDLSADEQRVARKKYLDVCDQIMYNLVVIKEDIEDIEMAKLTQETDLYEPPYVTIRKMREETEKQLDVYRQSLADIEQKLSQTGQKLSQAELELSQAQLELSQAGQKLSQNKSRSLNVVNELAGMRESRISRLMERFRRSDLLPLLNPAFQQFLDDSYLFQNVKGFLLQPSVNFQKVEYISYRLKLNRPGLCGIWIAPLLDIPLQQGWLELSLSPRKTKSCYSRLFQLTS